MKILRYKIFYSYRKFSLNNRDSNTAETVIALLAMISFMYFTPVITMLLKMGGLLQWKGLCWIIFCCFAFFNIKMIGKKYRAEIHEAVDYVMYNQVRSKDKLLIAFLSLFSFPYLLIAFSIMKSFQLI